MLPDVSIPSSAPAQAVAAPTRRTPMRSLRLDALPVRRSRPPTRRPQPRIVALSSPPEVAASEPRPTEWRLERAACGCRLSRPRSTRLQNCSEFDHPPERFAVQLHRVTTSGPDPYGRPLEAPTCRQLHSLPVPHAHILHRLPAAFGKSQFPHRSLSIAEAQFVLAINLTASYKDGTFILGLANKQRFRSAPAASRECFVLRCGKQVQNARYRGEHREDGTFAQSRLRWDTADMRGVVL